MFLGTVPAIISQFLYKEIKKINPKTVYVPFSGNFVVEQISFLACPSAKIYSTDISIYSRAIGFGVNDIDFKLEIKEELKNDFDFLTTKTDPLSKAALIILFSEVSKAYSKRNKIPYYKNLYNDAIRNQKVYYEAIIKKLESFKKNSKFVFYGYDACKLIQDIKKDDLVFYDPPVIQGDYEKQYSLLYDLLVFDDVPYTEINDKIKLDHLNSLNNLGANVFFRTNNPIIPSKGYDEVFRYKYKWSGSYCIYTNCNSERFVGSFSPLKEIVKNIKIISIDDNITENSKVDIIQQPSSVGNHYRLMWVHKAQMSDAGYSFLVFIDDKLIGMVQLESSIKFGTELIVIFSDPVSPTSKYKRLSKLILYLVCTKSMIKVINDLSMWEHKGFTTRVFTNEPVSMKYRGLFELIDRQPDEGSDYKYKLMYQNRDKIFETKEHGLKEWVKKYGRETIN